MRHAWLCAVVLLFSAPLQAAASDQTAAQVVVSTVLSTNVTASGQPIVLPQKDVHIVVSTYNIAKGAKLSVHEHPFARYAYVLAGRLQVTNTETGRSNVYKAGDFIVEAIGQSHQAANVGTGPVKLLVVDQVEGDGSNTVVRQ